MKLVIGGVFILICMLTVVSATKETVIFDDWTGYDSEVEHGNETFDIRGADVNDPDEEKGKILLKKGTERYIIEFGDCVESITYKYCFENRSFDVEGVDIDDKGQLQPALRISLIEYDLEVDMNAIKSMAKTSFRVDEESEIEITIENTGDFNVTNIELIDIVPDNFEVIKSEHAFVNNKLERTFNLFPGSTWTTSYTIKALHAKDTNISSNITYNAAGETFIEEFGEKNIVFVDSYDFDEPSMDEEFLRNDKTTFSFSIRNEESVDIDVQSIEIKVSPEVVATERKNVDKQFNNRFTNAKQSIAPGVTENFEIALEFPNVGEFEVEYELDVVVRNEVFSYNETFDFSVSLDELVCSIDIPDEVNASSIIRANIILENGEGEPFYEIQGNHLLGNQEGEYILSNINREQSVIADRVDFVIPFDLEEINYTLTHTAKYRTVDNQAYTCIFEKNITANPAIQLVKMNAYFQDEQANRNESTLLIIELENALNEPITEQIDIFVSSVHGNARPKLLDGLTTTQTIEIPFTIAEYLREETANVTANINIKALNNYADSIPVNITIANPYTGNLTIWELEEQERDELQEQLAAREEERQGRSFFDKVFDYLQDFFK